MSGNISSLTKKQNKTKQNLLTLVRNRKLMLNNVISGKSKWVMVLIIFKK